MVLLGYSLYKRMMIRIHNLFRDIGGTRLFFDSLAVFIGGVLCLCKPSLYFDYLKVVSSSKKYIYGEDSSRKSIEVCKTWNDDDISSLSIQSLSPLKVAVFVHGGAWGSGSVWMYRLIAQGYARVLGAQYTAIIGYPVYPEATILQQRDCILAALSLLQIRKEEIFNRDANFILIGHSSGANISALAILDSLETSGQACADAFIGVGGVYNIEHHYDFERRRGVHQMSPMAAAARGRQNFGECSPQLTATRLAMNFRDHLNTRTTNITSSSTAEHSATHPPANSSVSNNSAVDPSSNSTSTTSYLRNSRTLPTVCLLHGLHDTTVPPSASEHFATAAASLLGAENVHTVYTNVSGGILY